MNKLTKSFIEDTPGYKAGRLLVSFISEEMARRLSEKRIKGYRGWHTDECSNDQLLKRLRDNLNEMVINYTAGKIGMIDVVNLAAMIYAREQMYD